MDPGVVQDLARHPRFEHADSPVFDELPAREIETLAQGLGIPPAGLGPLILRTETAGPVAAAIALALDGARANASSLATNA